MNNIPIAPPGPPNKVMKETFFGSLVETKESKQATRDYEMFMKGYKYALGRPNIPQPGNKF